MYIIQVFTLYICMYDKYKFRNLGQLLMGTYELQINTGVSELQFSPLLKF